MLFKMLKTGAALAVLASAPAFAVAETAAGNDANGKTNMGALGISSDLQSVIAKFATAQKAEFDRETTEAEISSWFFDVYIPTWVAVGNGELDRGPEFVLDFWSTPMFVTGDEPYMALWLTEDSHVVEFLAMQHRFLKAKGFTHTHVPDSKVRAYNGLGGAVEVIWSRRAADNSEIQRYVVHFEVAKMNGTWKIIGGHTRTTDAEKDGDTIDGAWAL